MPTKSLPTEFYLTAQTLRDGRWIEGELMLWVNEEGTVHVTRWAPRRVIPENTVPPPVETWLGERDRIARHGFDE